MVEFFHKLIFNKTVLDCGARKRGIKDWLIILIWLETFADHVMKPDLP
jgi:hypothetical protein